MNFTNAEKEAIKASLDVPEEGTSVSPINVQLRKKLKMMVEKQVQKLQDTLVENYEHFSGFKK